MTSLLFFVYLLNLNPITFCCSVHRHFTNLVFQVQVSAFGKSKENVSSESDSVEDDEKDVLDSNVQLHAKPERQPSAMEISPERTLSDALPVAIDTLSRPPIHSVDTVDSVRLGTPLVPVQKSLDHSVALKSNNQLIPELCRRLENFSIFKESVHERSIVSC